MTTVIILLRHKYGLEFTYHTSKTMPRNLNKENEPTYVINGHHISTQ